MDRDLFIITENGFDCLIIIIIWNYVRDNRNNYVQRAIMTYDNTV